MFVFYTLPVVLVFQLAYNHAFSNTIFLLRLNLTYINVLVGVRGHLRDTEVARAMQLLQDGFSQRNIAATFGVSQSVASRLWKRFQTNDGQCMLDALVKAVESWNRLIWMWFATGLRHFSGWPYGFASH